MSHHSGAQHLFISSDGVLNLLTVRRAGDQENLQGWLEAIRSKKIDGDDQWRSVNTTEGIRQIAFLPQNTKSETWLGA